jgi:hypothetical protein
MGIHGERRARRTTPTEKIRKSKEELRHQASGSLLAAAGQSNEGVELEEEVGG